MSLSKGNLKAFLELLPLAILCHLTLTDTSANECVPAPCYSINTSTDTVCLSALFFAGSRGPRTASGNGKCRINTPGAREWRCIARVGNSTNGVPSAHPAFCFRPSCPSPARLPSRWKICFRFPFRVPRRAPLTSELFQLYVKTSTLREAVSKTVQDARTNSFLPALISWATANPRWPSSSLLPKCVKPCSDNTHQKQSGSLYEQNLNHTLPIWKHFYTKLKGSGSVNKLKKF